MLSLNCNTMKPRFILILTLLLSGEMLNANPMFFEMPVQFRSLQKYENSDGMQFEAKIFRSKDMLRIEPLLTEAHGGYTIINISKKIVYLIFPQKKQYLYYPYHGVSLNKSVIDDTFLFITTPLELIPVDQFSPSKLFSIKADGDSYELELDEHKRLPKALKRTENDFWTSVKWIDFVEEPIDSSLFSIPNGFVDVSPTPQP